MGRLVRDPELKTTPSGVSVCNCTIAVDRDFADKATGDRETDFIDIIAWRGTADFLNKHFGKGRMVCVSGRLQIRSWTDKDGNKRKNAEVVADNVYFADSKPSSSAQGGAAPAAPVGDFAPLADDADLPF
jgi:single-strand DNA-binding protein